MPLLLLQIRFHQRNHLTSRFHLLCCFFYRYNIEITVIAGISHFLCKADFFAYRLRKFPTMHKILVEIPYYLRMAFERLELLRIRCLRSRILNYLRMAFERLELQREASGYGAKDGIICPVVGVPVSLFFKITLRICQILFCNGQAIVCQFFRAAEIIQRPCFPPHRARSPPSPHYDRTDKPAPND